MTHTLLGTLQGSKFKMGFGVANKKAVTQETTSLMFIVCQDPSGQECICRIFVCMLLKVVLIRSLGDSIFPGKSQLWCTVSVIFLFFIVPAWVLIHGLCTLGVFYWSQSIMGLTIFFYTLLSTTIFHMVVLKQMRKKLTFFTLTLEKFQELIVVHA